MKQDLHACAYLLSKITAPYAHGNHQNDSVLRRCRCCTSARDGEEALGYLLTQRFDVLLTDLRMPVMDGIELLHQCETLPACQRPKRMIAISGEYDAGVLLGHPVQFMAKPFDVNTLLEMLGGRPN